MLERLKDLDDQESWQQFYTTYRKLIFSFAVKHGLTGTEAEEVVQETVITVARNLPEFRYDPQRCAFKTWLLNLTLWRIQDQLRKRRPETESIHRKPGASDRTATVERVPGPEGEALMKIWDEEWRQHTVGFFAALICLSARRPAVAAARARTSEAHPPTEPGCVRTWPNPANPGLLNG